MKKANILNEYFASVGTIDNDTTPGSTKSQPRIVLDTIVFDTRNIIAAVRKLKVNLSAGPDGLPPLLYKRLQSSIAKPLALLFAQLFCTGVVPEAWKTAIIVPVFKKGTASNVANYRPISLTCVASKIMERVIAKCIYDYLASNNLLSGTQHGFIKGRSTCTMNDWTLSVQNKKGVSIAYIDFTRAFDSVTHTKLFNRLYNYRIQGDLLHWLTQFFSGRTH